MVSIDWGFVDEKLAAEVAESQSASARSIFLGRNRNHAASPASPNGFDHRAVLVEADGGLKVKPNSNIETGLVP